MCSEICSLESDSPIYKCCPTCSYLILNTLSINFEYLGKVGTTSSECVIRIEFYNILFLNSSVICLEENTLGDPYVTNFNSNSFSFNSFSNLALI